MSSLNTNASAMTALQTLSATNKNLATVQSRISTGLRVGEAADNAAYWSIATTMRSDNKALSTVQDALGLGAGKIDVAYTAMNAAIEVVDEIKAKLVAARGASEDDREKIQAEISALQSQLESIGRSATFSGTNILASEEEPDDLNIVASFDRDASGSISISTITFEVMNALLFTVDETTGALISDVYDADDEVNAASGLLNRALAVTVQTLDDSDPDPESWVYGSEQAYLNVSLLTLDITSLAGLNATDEEGEDIDDLVAPGLDQLIDGVDAVLAGMITAASDLGAVKKRVDMQSDFVSKLQDAIDRGVGQLVDADMNKESARLSALQVQQQLGIQALSIANSNAQNILSLFRS